MTTISDAGRFQALRQDVARMRSGIDEAQRQLASGKKAETHGGLGADARLSLSLRAGLERVQGFDRAIGAAQTRAQAMQTAIESARAQLREQAAETRGALYDNPAGVPFLGGTAESRLQDLISSFNLELEGRHLFAGGATETTPLADARNMIEGADGAIGLRGVADLRAAADSGGRLATAQDAVDPSIVRISDGAPAFGFELRDAAADGGVSAAAGAPASGLGAREGALAGLEIDFDALAPGDTIRLEMALPDGTDVAATFTAAGAAGLRADIPASGPVSVDASFAIGADADASAANFKAVLDSALARISSSEVYAAASTARAADDFFDPDGPLTADPAAPASAAVLTRADADEVVSFYRGERGGDPAAGQRVRADTGMLVDYGVRADEAALSGGLKGLALQALAGFEPDALDLTRATHARAADRIAAAEQGLIERQGALGSAQQTLESVGERHARTAELARKQLAEAENADPYAAATRLSELRNQLETAFAVTARLQNLSLANFLR